MAGSDTPSEPPNTGEQKRLTDEEMLARFQNTKKRPPCSETVGMRLTAVNQQKMTASYEFEGRQEFANPTGAIQGGFIAAMMDEAMSALAIIASNVTMNAPTLEMKISFLRPLFIGKATAEARILKWGRSTCFIEAELFDPEGRLVAKASATQAPKPFKRF